MKQATLREREGIGGLEVRMSDPEHEQPSRLHPPVERNRRKSFGCNRSAQ
jgi:hypothetical protein